MYTSLLQVLPEIFRFCNVVHIILLWTIRAIPTYRVGRLYDIGGVIDSVLIKGVSLFQRSIIDREVFLSVLTSQKQLPSLVERQGGLNQNHAYQGKYQSCGLSERKEV